MSWEATWAEAAVARRFVERLSGLPAADLRPPLAPVLDRDPYLSAWRNVQAALGNAPPADRGRLEGLIAELDARLADVAMLPSLREAAGRSVRALLVRRWLLTPESLAFVYEPFERVVPLDSLGE